MKKAGNLATAIGIAAVGVAAAIFGNANDAPGLVLLGILLIVSAFVLGVRTAQHSSRTHPAAEGSSPEALRVSLAPCSTNQRSSSP